MDYDNITDPAVFGPDALIRLAVIANAAAEIGFEARRPDLDLPTGTAKIFENAALQIHLAIHQLVAPLPSLDRTDDLQTARQHLTD